MAMTCDKVMDSLPHVKWSQAISPMLTALRETCIKDISDRMAPMIASFHFRHLANVSGTPALILKSVVIIYKILLTNLKDVIWFWWFRSAVPTDGLAEFFFNIQVTVVVL